LARSRYNILDNDPPYFLTATIVNWLPLFNSPAVVEFLFDSLRFRIRNRYGERVAEVGKKEGGIVKL
jgi:hypothetical protein